MKRPYRILLTLAGALALTAIVIAANVVRSRSQVRGVEADIRYGRTERLVDERVVVDSIVAAIPQLPAMQVRQVDCGAVAAAARRVPYLCNATASVSVSGKVVVRADQRRPVARLIYGGRAFYIDRDGAVMPMSDIGDCDVLVAGGDFVEPFRADSLNGQTAALLKLANYLDSERRYRGMIDQIYVERDGDMMMVPKLGGHVVELGEVERLDEKFANLWLFYLKGMPRAGWNTYSRISLKYEGQVVCTKETK